MCKDLMISSRAPRLTSVSEDVLCKTQQNNPQQPPWPLEPPTRGENTKAKRTHQVPIFYTSSRAPIEVQATAEVSKRNQQVSPHHEV